MPYIRRYPNFKPEEVKFEYEYEREVTKTVQKKSLDEKGVLVVTETYTETAVDRRIKKVHLKCYGHTSEEDGVHFMQCLVKMFKELKEEVQKSSQKKDQDASILFRATDKMLIGTANANWLTALSVVSQETDNVDPNGNLKSTWEVFKKSLAKYICTQVFTESGIYDRQVEYMQGRHKPKSMTAKEWHRAIQEYNSYMCYLFPDLAAMKRQFTNLTFKEWMTRAAGALTQAQERRIILENVKDAWKSALKLHDIGRVYRETKNPEELVDYYTTLEGLEQHRARQTPNGRHNQTTRRAHTANEARSGFRQDRRGQSGSNNSNRFNRQNNRQQGRGQGSNSGRDHHRQGYTSRTGTNNGQRTKERDNNGGNRSNDRYGGQRNGGNSGNNQQQRSNNGPGRFQGQEFRSRYQRPSGQSYYQESQEDAPNDYESDNHGEINELDQEPEEQEELYTEAQWLERWNQQFEENLYLDASDSSGNKQNYVEDEDGYAIEEEDDEYEGGIDYAAIDGSGYL